MATALRIKGGSALKARLVALESVPPAFAATWAEDAAQRMRRTAPNARRPASRRWETKSTPKRGGVYGAFWWIFVDRGTKAHDIEPKNAKSLRWTDGGRTIFAKKVHKKRQRRNPFISEAAQKALEGSAWADLVIKTWNRRRIGSRKRFI